MKNKLILLAATLIFCALSAILYFINPHPNGHYEIDSHEYISVAKHYYETGKLVSPDQPTTMTSHTLGYHLFLGTIFSLFNQNIQSIFFLQLLLCILCSFMLYNSALLLFSQKTASIVSILFSINLGFLVYAQMVLSEILLVTLLTSFIYFFCLYLTTQKKLPLIASGLLLGISVIVKPVALFYIMPLTTLVFFFAAKKIYQNILLCLILLCSFYFPVSLYMCYNKITFDHFCVTNLVSENIYIYFLPRRILPQLDEATQMLFLEKIESGASKEEKLALSKEIFFSIAKKHPVKILYAWANAMMRTFFGLYSTQLKSLFNPSIQGGSCSFFNMQGTLFERIYNYITFGSTSLYLSIIALLEGCWLLLQYLFILIAMLSLLQQKRYALLSFFCSYIGYFSFVTGHDGCGRYRLMLEPILLMLTALGIMIIYYALTRQKEHSIKANPQFSTE